jgi:uncharacterized membrane protein YhaH (DUF805 family)
MSFAEAVKTCLSKYATFAGRARRSEYWWFVLFNVIVSIVAAIIDGAAGTDLENSSTGVVGGIVALALILPSLAVTARRLHDTGRSGWWILIGIIPLIGAIILIVFACQDSDGVNQYGPNPKFDQPGRTPGYAA